MLLGILARRSRRTPGLMGGLLLGLAGVIGLLPDARASDASYTYDSNGNILTRSAPDTTTYSYDALDRLTREQGPVITQSFGYDGGGNRQSDGIGSYVYAPSSNRLTNRPQGAVTLDGAGHTTAQAGFSYTWDGAGRLKTVSLSGTLLATYHYDARHRRTRKETTAAAPQGVATVLYAYDQDDHLLAETDATGPIRSYLWRDDTPVAQVEHRPTRKVLYLETDHLNTPRAARNEAGARVWRWEADAFGSSLPDEDPDGDGQATAVNLRYPGQYFDPESGLHYNQARYYDPTTGRYLSPDPIGLAGGLNTYSYVLNNPLKFIDPTGLSTAVVDRGNGTIAVTLNNGQTVTYPAGNNTTNPSADPNTVGSNGPAPAGTWPVQSPINTSGDFRYGPYFWPIGAVDAQGNRADIARQRGIGLHGGRRSHQSRTQGCVRMDDADIQDLYQRTTNDPLTTIEIR